MNRQTAFAGTSSTMPLMGLSKLVNNNNARAPHANISNAGHLFGDAEDDDYDDPDGIYGDAAYGDIADTAALDTWNTLIGDSEEEMGAPLKFPKIKKFKNWSTGAKVGAGVAAAGLAGFGVTKLIQARKKRQARINAALNASANQNTIARQVQARQMMGKISRTAPFPFYQIIGATLNSYPLAPTENFPADILKYNFDRQQTDTPFEVEIVNGTFAGVTWTVQATGVATTRYYTAVFLNVGISVLNANPGTIFSVTGVLPTFNGPLTISANPFSFTLRSSVYYAKLLIFPWQLITNKPVLALGAYSNASPITLSVTGLPSTASVSMIVPGSQHPWTIAMRNRLV